MRGAWTPRLNSVRQYVGIACLTVHSMYPNSFQCLQYIYVLAIDNVVKRLGVLFVILAVFLTSLEMVIYYIYVLPYILTYDLHWILFHLIIAHYLLGSAGFHYCKAVSISNGKPSKITLNNIGIKSICRKCHSPKPPRTHHCRVCNKCVMKMDHHCPWLNNCVGHLNHRHFLQFCIFMLTGTVYLDFTVWPLFRDKFLNIPEEEVGEELEHTSMYDFQSMIQLYIFLSTGLMVCMTLLTVSHIRLISRGETNVEALINGRETKRLNELGLIFHNPYDFGLRENWRMFLGLRRDRRFWSHIAIPSGHPPEENGYEWKSNSHKGHINQV
ncbi:palmitoyltransferase ZDHHC16-like [Glandiceps talaboti]